MRAKASIIFAAAAVIAMACSFSTPAAHAQAVYGSILGTVTDPQGAAVAGAKVTITNQRKGTTDQTATNADGNYSVTHLVPDVYSIRVEAAGFKVSEQKDVVVSADTGSRVDLQFQVGGTSETVEVTAEAPQLKTDRSDVAIQFNEKYVENLPVLNRNFTSFELLSPGTQLLAGWNHASTENPQGSQQIFVNGQHFSGTGYELDGTDNQDPILGIIVVNPNLDAITETKVALQNYDAEFGKAVAGLVTVQTKSGSNEFHGSAYFYRRSDATQARDPFTQYAPDPITHRFLPHSRWTQFGGTIGGPILKDKLFFFGDYQGTRQSSGISSVLTIPTAQVLSTCIGAGDGSGFCKLDQYTSLFGNGKAGDPSTLLYDPKTGTVDASGIPSGLGRTPFCGPAGCATEPNWIPMTAAAAASVGVKSTVSPVAQNILQLFAKLTPSNSSVQNNFVGSGNGPFNANSFDTRIDYSVTPTVSTFGRFSLAYFNLSGTGMLGALGGTGTGLNGLSGSSITHNYSVSWGLNKTFSSTLLADFRFGYFKYNPTTHKPDEGQTPAKNVGIPNVNLGDVSTSGWPSFQGDGPNSQPGVWSAWGDGLNVGRCNCPLTESEQQFQFVTNWTKIRGNHQIKVGADIRHAMNLRIPSDADRAGVMSMGSGVTSDGGVGGNSIGTFLIGDVRTMNRFVSRSLNAAERQNRLFFYVEDSWRVTPKLTFNYGIRWENYFPEYVNGKGNGGFANPVEGIIRVAGYGKYGLNGNIATTWTSLAPRLGIAYQVTPKTVVRMGYGRSYDMGVFGSNFGHAVTQNLPVLVNQGVSASNNVVNNALPACVGSDCINDAYFAAFSLDQGPPLYVFPAIPANGVLPLGGPGNNVQPRMRPTYQRLPTLDAWNLTVQRQVTNTISVEVGYVANKGTNVFAGNGPAYDLNPVPFGPGTSPVTGTFSNGSAAPAGTLCSTPGVTCSIGFVPTVPANNRRPYYNRFTYSGYIDPSTGTTMVCCNNGVVMGNYFGNDASANYNALQIKVDKRFSQGLQFQANYTYSHANNFSADNNTGSGGNCIYGVDPSYCYGPDDMNRNHVFIANAVYELPFGRGKQFGGNASRAWDYVIGGWQLNNTLNWSGGLPWMAGAGECGQVNDTGPCRPDQNGSFHMGAGSFNKNTHLVPFFTPVSALGINLSPLTVGENTCPLARPSSGPFSLPACGGGGNVGRNSFRGPHAFSDDLAITKNFRITERVNAQFRMDAYNVFNHPIYDFSSQDYQSTGGACIDCGGKNGFIQDIQYGTTMRELQFGLRVQF